MANTVNVRAVVDVMVDADKVAALNQQRINAGRTVKTVSDEVEERIGDAFGGLCEIAPLGARVTATVIE